MNASDVTDPIETELKAVMVQFLSTALSLKASPPDFLKEVKVRSGLPDFALDAIVDFGDRKISWEQCLSTILKAFDVQSRN